MRARWNGVSSWDSSDPHAGSLPVYRPEWNGIAKRKNCTLMEMARTMRQHARLPPQPY